MADEAPDRLSFRRLSVDDLDLLGTWLAAPHVHRWWHHETSPAALTRDFGPTMRGEEPNEDLLVLVGERPVGLVQRCRWHDYPEYVAEVAGQFELPREALTIDYLIGPADQVGRGLGPRIIEAVCRDAWSAYPAATAVVVPVSAANRRSWRALEKAGFRRVADADLEPDNPRDDRRHHVYRLDRPAAEPG